MHFILVSGPRWNTVLVKHYSYNKTEQKQLLDYSELFEAVYQAADFLGPYKCTLYMQMSEYCPRDTAN